MRDYGRVYASFWTSADMQSLSDDGRLLALYLLSGPHGTLAGVCRLPEGYVCEDLKWPAKRVSKGFAELFRKGFCNRCETSNWVWIRKFLAWNPPENPNQWKAARKIAAQVPDSCAFKAEFLGLFAIFESGKEPPTGKGSPTVTEPLPKPLPTQEQYQEQEQDIETVPKPRREAAPLPPAKPNGKARKPTKAPIPDDFPNFAADPELEAYVRKQLPDVDLPTFAEAFRGKAIAKGWTYANWRAALQEFSRNCAPKSGHWASGQYPKAGQAIQWQ